MTQPHELAHEQAARISESITAQELEYIAKDIALTKLRDTCARVEADLVSDIAQAKIEGKAQFSNEQSRAAELARRKLTDPDWQAVIGQRETKERELRELRVAIDGRHRDFKLASLTFEALAIGRRHL